MNGTETARFPDYGSRFLGTVLQFVLLFSITEIALALGERRARMAANGTPEEILNRIKPTLDKVAVQGLRAWLRSIDFSVPANTRASITDFVVERIVKGDLEEAALDVALIGFEEASDMRVYLFRMEREAARTAGRSLPTRLRQFGIPETNAPRFAGARTGPMSPVYACVQGDLARIKWAEEQKRVQVNARGTGVETTVLSKKAVLIVNFAEGVAELRLNPPENVHSYEDAGGRITQDAYYDAYKRKALDVLGCEAELVELRPVIKQLVEEEEPRVIRIHIDNHTNQRNYKTKTTGPKADVRDDPDWRLAYRRNGETWAWDAQSFYWLPRASSGFLKREVFTHIDADEKFVKVNADCSNEEVEYVVSQVRAREAAASGNRPFAAAAE